MDIKAKTAMLEQTLKAQQQLFAVGMGPCAPPIPRKREYLQEAIDADGGVLLQVDATLPGVHVPLRLLGNPGVVLRFGRSFESQDLILTDTHIGQTLHFAADGNEFVRVPLLAVMALKSVGPSGRRLVFVHQEHVEVCAVSELEVDRGELGGEG